MSRWPILLMVLFTCRLHAAELPTGTVLATTGPASRPAREPAGGRVVSPEKRTLPGQRFAIGEGEVFVPDFFKAGEKVDLIIWFLGAPWIVEQEFYEAHKNAVLLVASSQTLQKNFPGPRHFQNLLGNVRAALIKKEITDKPVGRVCLCSFSGGYTAVRQLLTFDEVVKQVSDVVLCDSLYASHVSGPDSELDELQLKPFLDYARLAAAGEKNLFYSQLFPPEAKYRGNTTTLTANYLIDHVGAKPVACTQSTSRGTPILYSAEMNGFHLFGYAGMTNQDHFDHLYSMHDLLKRTSLEDGTQLKENATRRKVNETRP